MYTEFSEIKGKTATEVRQTLESIEFTFDDGSTGSLRHDQDCCESVNLEDVVGNLSDLVGTPITMAYEETNGENPKASEYPPDSFTWSFYRLGTIKGQVTIRFYGESNGYYSETASFHYNPVDS